VRRADSNYPPWIREVPHADRAWRMMTSELVKAHADWLDEPQPDDLHATSV
jgi:hypothetical protein